MRNKIRISIGVIIVAAFGFAGVLSYAPDRIPTAIQTQITAVEDTASRTQTFVGVATVLLVYSLWRHYTSQSPAPTSPFSTDTADTTGTVDTNEQQVGAAYTATVSDAMDRIADKHTIDDTRVVTPLRTALIDVLMAQGCPHNRAEAYVDTGAWTDNRTTAVFLGSERAGDYSLYYRVYAWLLPERAFNQRVHAAVDRVSAYAAATDRDWRAIDARINTSDSTVDNPASDSSSDAVDAATESDTPTSTDGGDVL